MRPTQSGRYLPYRRPHRGDRGTSEEFPTASANQCEEIITDIVEYFEADNCLAACVDDDNYDDNYEESDVDRQICSEIDALNLNIAENIHPASSQSAVYRNDNECDVGGDDLSLSTYSLF